MTTLSDDPARRLGELREEYAEGLRVMTQMQRKQEELRSRLLRISGAIQVLEELLAPADAAAAD